MQKPLQPEQVMDKWTAFIGKTNELLRSRFSSSTRIKKSKSSPTKTTKKLKNDWKPFLKKSKNLASQGRFEDANKVVTSGLKKFPKELKLLLIATHICRASGNLYKSLEYSELIITHHPDNWKGYGRAAQDLLALKRYKEAQDKVQNGLDKNPNQINLLSIASDIYSALGDHKKSLENIELLVRHHPDNWIGYYRAAQGLIQIKQFEKALTAINKSPEKNNDSITSLKNKLERRKIMLHKIKSRKLRTGHSYPSFCIAGNCQSAPLEIWLKSNFPFCSIKKLEPYHLIETQSQIDKWIEDAKQADFVMMIPVADSYGGFQFGSNYIRSQLSENTEFILYPSYHLEVFYPFFGYAKTGTGATLRGEETSHLGHPYGDYHDFLSMALSTKSDDAQRKFFKAIREIDRIKYFTSPTIINLAIQSFNEFERRYPDYIDLIKFDIKRGITHTFNHPTGSLLNKIYKKIWLQDFRLSANDFLDFTQDPLSRMRLPIPAFVSRTILGETQNIPWQASPGSNYVYENSDKYISKILQCISFYQANPEVLEWNIESKKLASSNNFLNELGI